VRLLAARFYRHLAEEDLADHPVETVVSHATELLDFARHRTPGHASVRAIAGADDESTVVEVITDDMPFLVDSVTRALAAAGRSVHLVVHPQLVVRRDDAGNLVELIDAVIPDGSADVLAESWMWLELERDFDGSDGSELEDRVNAALDDVRSAVRDWQAMRAKALALADEIVASRPTTSPSSAFASTSSTTARARTYSSRWRAVDWACSAAATTG